MTLTQIVEVWCLGKVGGTLQQKRDLNSDLKSGFEEGFVKRLSSNLRSGFGESFDKLLQNRTSSPSLAEILQNSLQTGPYLGFKVEFWSKYSQTFSKTGPSTPNRTLTMVQSPILKTIWQNNFLKKKSHGSEP